jgi:CHAT domain-containing protein
MGVRIGQGVLLAIVLLAFELSPATTCDRSGSGASAHGLGDDSTAIGGWTATIERGAASPAAVIEARIRRGESYRALGRYEDAKSNLAEAVRAARSAGDPLLQAVATQALGQVYAGLDDPGLAEKTLNDGLQQARRLARPALIAAGANALGNLRLEQGRPREARAFYRQALEQAQAANDPGLSAAVHINLARVAATRTGALRELRAAQQATTQVAAPAEQAQLLLDLAQQGIQSAPTNPGRKMADGSLREAERIAARAEYTRLQSQALGLSSSLAAAQGRRAEARRLAERAIAVAPADAYDLRYQWEWQLGRLLREAGDRPRAIAAYRRAVDHLQRVREYLPLKSAEGRSQFRETLEPIYRGLADLLLQEAATRGNASQAQPLLREARNSVEQVKLDELRDYFRDACILPLREEIGTLSPRAAVVYPILFADRLEILVSIGEHLYRAARPIPRDKVEHTAAVLARQLRLEQPAREEAELLYDWLITPILPWLEERHVDTIVYVPDGALRMVPLSALEHDGRYLIERYAVATTPGLKLLEPEALGRAQMETLLAGLSRPGPVVDEVPRWWVNILVERHRQILQRHVAADQRGVSVSVRGVPEGMKPQGSPLTIHASRAEEIEALTLPGVAEEIDQLSKLVPGRTLRDQDFLLSRFKREVRERPYRVIHIASHGLFLGPPEENFVLTYDRKLDMKTLAAILKPKELDERPIEILVLSACQTATGDDRTPLGLSGVALQSGARSALGSLWPVGDSAAQLLMQYFYDNLKTPGMTKARALQEAQKALIRNERFRRPSDWAAFILVGNWL